MYSNLTGWHLVILASIPLLVLFVAAIVSIARATATGTEKAIWVLVALVFPIAGPIVWFAVGKRTTSSP
ncbi:PLDc_N domain-containing protein [Labedella phragmitis]|uniref:PLDc_N domain-containing protein n=1 Tax=Labedella phragmitis TaxID=2498849 RepID=A0A3S3Z517_9MICO|nr:PLD nuclease N-terminal domain-containing protein [Labedella phragmitis]RWZ51902.1 PLDc_N domain-containing protein [Labedella phragmitis]